MVEPDAIGNTMAVLDSLPVHRVLNATHSIHMRMLTHRWREFSDERGYSLERLPWGEEFRVGDRRLVAVQPAAKVIATSWLYDLESKVLFSSDFFGHLHCERPHEDPVATGGEVSADEIRTHLLAKYEWLADADTEPIRRRLAEIFESHQVDVIAPGHGRILRGPETVRRHLEATLRALEDLGRRRSPAKSGDRAAQ
jgi:flavorubredoxin